ncbi:hypothetical protein JAAARDRAFT_190479 [Jaapia argillacea MUCL 33604]|uniref:Fungal-type protein kinase domain-containing protein n=1 Tax=Jaapia argillacea MUCL 33604 TaxID=933084 RepID=A0A067Q3W5_9AGAM|nr:hypothetical protein JAAARDRAFT_190479 [Jaapia argillacea MUCL 33604]
MSHTVLPTKEGDLPTTPQRKPQRTNQEALKSTPSLAHGTASAANSETQRILHVSKVKPLLHEDLKRSETCGFKQLLKAFLLRCQILGDNQTADMLLEQCLVQILPICNDDESIRDSLKDYCKAKGHEQVRYAPFVKAFNAALRRMKDLAIPGIRPPSSLGIAFHRNDPNRIPAHHYGSSTSRSPDTLLASTGSAHRANPRAVSSFRKGSTRSIEEAVHSLAPEKRKKKFYWSDCLSAQEFKKNEETLTPPPLQYNLDLAEVDPQQVTPESLRDLDVAAEFDSTFDIFSSTDGGVTETSDSGNPGDGTAGSETLGNSGLKRKAEEVDEDEDEGPVDKKPRTDPKAPPLVQCASYAAEMLSRGAYTTHAINLFIVDNVAWVWWFDRQGAIQSHGVNFVLNLPYFLVLLVAFQRFELQHWGICEKLCPTFTRRHKASSGRLPERVDLMERFDFKFPGGMVSINPAHLVHAQYSLLGRATRIIGAQLGLTGGEGMKPDDDHVVKISWPEESRQNEARIIALAKEAGKHDELIRPHLPILIDHVDLGFNTGQIREDLGIARNSPRGSRVLRVLLFLKLKPMSSLSGEKFMNAWIQCYRCHFRLWLNGIEHGDISASNLMVHPATGDGILNDYDLTVLRKKDEDRAITGTERTGTIPFMALDLLTKDFFDGKIRRIYRHDNESFIWVLPWIFLRGKSSQALALNKWATSDFAGCRELKFSFLLVYHEYHGYPEANKQPYKAASRLLRWLQDQARAVQTEVDSASESDVDENVEPVFQVRHRNDASEQAACIYFRQFEANLKRRWGYGFEPLPEGKTVPLTDEERIKLD